MPAGMCSLAGTEHHLFRQTGGSDGTTLPIIAFSWFMITPETRRSGVGVSPEGGEIGTHRNQEGSVCSSCAAGRELGFSAFTRHVANILNLLGGGQRMAF